jgi:metal-sulfur cluster biosynthetic enzyme
MGEVLLEDVEAALRAAVPAGTRIEVELVWSPPWDPSMMSDAALHLTLLARVGGDLLDRWPMQRWSGLANGATLLLFILTLLASVARGARSKGTKR